MHPYNLRFSMLAAGQQEDLRTQTRRCGQFAEEMEPMEALDAARDALEWPYRQLAEDMMGVNVAALQAAAAGMTENVPFVPNRCYLGTKSVV
jgi:hypothetical protein